MPVSVFAALAGKDWQPEPTKKKKKKYKYVEKPPRVSAFADTAATNSRKWAARRNKYCPGHAPSTQGLVNAVQQLSRLFKLLQFEASPRTRSLRLPNRCADLAEVFKAFDKDDDGLSIEASIC